MPHPPSVLGAGETWFMEDPPMTLPEPTYSAGTLAHWHGTYHLARLRSDSALQPVAENFATAQLRLTGLWEEFVALESKVAAGLGELDSCLLHLARAWNAMAERSAVSRAASRPALLGSPEEQLSQAEAALCALEQPIEALEAHPDMREEERTENHAVADLRRCARRMRTAMDRCEALCRSYRESRSALDRAVEGWFDAYKRSLRALQLRNLRTAEWPAMPGQSNAVSSAPSSGQGGS